jgi:hypothetical protein
MEPLRRRRRPAMYVNLFGRNTSGQLILVVRALFAESAKHGAIGERRVATASDQEWASASTITHPQRIRAEEVIQRIQFV